MEKIDYSLAQQSQIQQGLKEGIKGFDKINVLCSVSQIRDFRTLFKEKTNAFRLLDRKDINFMLKNWNRIPDLSYIPNNTAIKFFKEYIKIMDIIGMDKTRDLFAVDKFCPNDYTIKLIKSTNDLKSFNIALFEFNDYSDKFLKFDKEELDSIYKTFNNLSQKDEITDENIKDLLSLSFLITKEEKENLKLIESFGFEEIYKYNILLKKGYKFSECLKYDISTSVAEIVPKTYKKENTTEIFQKYGSILDKLNTCLGKGRAGEVIHFAMCFDLNKSFLEDMKDSFMNLSSDECALLCDIAENYNIVKETQNISKNNILEKTFFMFDKNYSLEQKRELARNFRRQIYSNKFIADFVDSSYSPFQISFLRDNLLNGKKIENALNSKFTVEHMKHIIYFNSKGKTLTSDTEYDDKYTEIRNKDFDKFLNLYDDIFDSEYAVLDRIKNIKQIAKINKEYNLNLDVEKISANSRNIDIIENAIHFCKIYDQNIKDVLENRPIDEIPNYINTLRKDFLIITNTDTENKRWVITNINTEDER